MQSSSTKDTIVYFIGFKYDQMMAFYFNFKRFVVLWPTQEYQLIIFGSNAILHILFKHFELFKQHTGGWYILLKLNLPCKFGIGHNALAWTAMNR